MGRAILLSLGSTELLLRVAGKDVPLLDEFFSGVTTGLQRMTASHRIALAASTRIYRSV